MISEISKIMDNIQICAPRPAQQSVADFLPNLENFIDNKCNKIGEKANLFSNSLPKSTGWEISSIGTFFAYVRHPFKDIKCDKLSKILASKCGLITIPGIYFGKKQERYLRLSIAGLSNEEIIEVKNRLDLLNEHLK